jgi:phosphoribosylformylglycinamidine synthase PurS subunit
VYIARIRVLLRSGVSDPQGQTVEGGLRQLGFQGVESVRVGKYVEVRIQAADDAQAERTIGEMCDRLLANPVIEDYSFELERLD